jgi:hypothetical protein
MRASYWLIGALVVTGAAAGGLAAGCSSASSNPFGVPEDSGSDSSSRSDASVGAHDAGADAACSLATDASLALFAAADASDPACSQCVLGMCKSEVAACERNCACVTFFTCIANLLDAGGGADMLATCTGGDAGVAALETNPTLTGLYTCYSQPCASVCMAAAVADGGSPPDAGLPDSGPPEGGVTDSGAADGSLFDGGALDAGALDGGVDAADGG